MRLSAHPSSGALAAAALALLSTVELVYARPSPEPKVPARTKWAQNRGKKIARSALKHSLESRWPNTTVAACSDAAAHAITAPYENVWGGLTDAEAVSVVSWLFAQPALNLTATADAGSWDNTL